MNQNVKVVTDVSALAREAAAIFVQIAQQSIEDSGRFSVALAGGSTPKALFQLLVSADFKSKIDWSKVDVYFGDERCVPPDHPDSNFLMAKTALLDKVPVAEQNVFRMKGEIDPQTAAIEYGKMLKSRFGEGGVNLCLLGMGDDGHTASLFPGTPALSENSHRCVAQFVEKSTTGPSWRITLTAPFINRSDNVLVLVSGHGKADRLREVLSGPEDPFRLPIQMIKPPGGELLFLVDSAAAEKLSDENNHL